MGDIPHMDHVGKVVFGHFDGEGFDLTGPQGRDAAADRRQREAANPIEEGAHRQHCIPSGCGRASSRSNGSAVLL